MKGSDTAPSLPASPVSRTDTAADMPAAPDMAVRPVPAFLLRPVFSLLQPNTAACYPADHSVVLTLLTSPAPAAEQLFPPVSPAGQLFLPDYSPEAY